ncbi:glycosyltransferase [bacterium]|nr:glycosyltransferase [bacterium]
MNKLTVLIPTFNEEQNLPDCLQSAAWADEILVVDSFSTDRTRDIAQSHSARILQHPYESHAAQRNWAIPQATHPWVFLLDADERITPALQEEIQALLQTGPSIDAYRVARRTFYFGREAKFGGFGNDWVTRLVKQDTCRIEECGFHGDFKLDFTPGKLKGKLIHYTCNSIEEYFQRFEMYTTGGARRLYHKNKTAGFLEILGRPLWRFLHRYILRLGFLDGRLGLILCMLSAFYVFTKYMKLWYYNNTT